LRDMTIEIKVLLFASAREASGNIPETSLTLEDGATTSTFR
jgi:molybdopterin converting factor small subunit